MNNKMLETENDYLYFTILSIKPGIFYTEVDISFIKKFLAVICSINCDSSN